MQNLEEPFSLVHNAPHIGKHALQVSERLDRSDMTGNIHLKRALRAEHVMRDPRGEQAIANAQTR